MVDGATLERLCGRKSTGGSNPPPPPAKLKINRAILPPGRIGLAVSGGADSVALAFLLTKGGKKKNAAKRFVVLHVDHGLRKESKEEYRFVRALATRLGVPFKGVHAKVVRRRGESLEMAARRVRLAFFSTCMKTLKLDAIATGHHMDDVAETFLMKLRRVSLCGIRETSAVGDIRFVVDPYSEATKDVVRVTLNADWASSVLREEAFALLEVKGDSLAATAISIPETLTVTAAAGANHTKKLTATLTPSNSTSAVTWSSSATGKATVDENGNVTGVASGSATITATCNGLTDTCTVTVS